METTLLFGFISGGAILLGAILGLYLKLNTRLIAVCMAFGAGVLISALSIDLMEDAFDKSHSPYAVALGFLSGALVFVVGDYFIDQRGGHRRRHSHAEFSGIKKSAQPQENNSGTAILLGTLLDGIPESFVLGASIAVGGTTGVVFVVAIFLSNLPEGMSGTIGMKMSGMSSRNIWLLWLTTFVVTILSCVAGYVFSEHLSPSLHASTMAFASGAILAMLCDTMIPEAFKFGGRFVALVTVVGFLLAFLLSKAL